MRETAEPSGLKFEEGKCRMDLLPEDALREVGWVLTANLEENGGKYAERNWEQGAEWHRYYGAIRRHLGKFWSGEDFDQDPEGSHLAHLSHVACLSLMLLAHWMRDIGVDDRPEECTENLTHPLRARMTILDPRIPLPFMPEDLDGPARHTLVTDWMDLEAPIDAKAVMDAVRSLPKCPPLPPAKAPKADHDDTAHDRDGQDTQDDGAPRDPTLGEAGL